MFKYFLILVVLCVSLGAGCDEGYDYENHDEDFAGIHQDTCLDCYPSIAAIEKASPCTVYMYLLGAGVHAINVDYEDCDLSDLVLDQLDSLGRWGYEPKLCQTAIHEGGYLSLLMNAHAECSQDASEGVVRE